MTKGGRTSAIWLLAVALIILLLFSQIAKASGKKTSDDVSTTSSVETSIAGDSSRTLAVSHSLGDVDINQCIVTKQTGSFIVSWQGYDYNAWCMGEVYDQKGLYGMAALMRCDIPVIRVHFKSDAACVTANTMQIGPDMTSHLDELYSQTAEYGEREDEHEQQIARLEQQVADQQQQFDDWQQRVRNYQPPQQQPFLSNEKRKALQELIEK